MTKKQKMPSVSDQTKGLRTQVYSCSRCEGCLAVCPTYRATGEEALSARGRTALIEAVLDGKLGLTRGLAERLSKCLECGACAASCPTAASTLVKPSWAMRQELRRAGCRHVPRLLLLRVRLQTGRGKNGWPISDS
ncbi:MAG: 4Fe-4S dicluster domain-containing protein [Thermoleophilia bacterium]